MWPWRRVRLATDAEVQTLLYGLKKQLDQQALEVKRLEDNLALLEGKHERLRGRVYATGQHRTESAGQSKADILRDFGFRPGQPAPHK